MERTLFRHLHEDIFLVFSRSNRHLYGHVILEVFREYFGSTVFRSPFRSDIVAFIAEVLRTKPELWSEDEGELLDLPADPRRRRRARSDANDGRMLDPVMLKARHVYARLVRCGWIEEEAFGFNVKADMTPGALVLADQLSIINEGISQLFGGVVVTVRSALEGLEKDPAGNALGLRQAAESAILFMRRLRAIYSSLKGIEREIMGSENLDERVRTFFEDFIGRLLIDDFRAILTTNHPYRFKGAVIDAAEKLTFDDVIKARVAKAYIEAQVAETDEKAYELVVRQLTTIQDVFHNVDDVFDRINMFRSRLESRLRNTVRYLDRSDSGVVARLVDAIERLDKLAHIQPDADVPALVAPIEPLLDHRALASPPPPRAPIEEVPLLEEERDPAIAVYRQMLREFQGMFDVPEDKIARWLETRVPPFGDTEARWLQIQTLEDFLVFERLRRFVIAVPTRFAEKFELEPADGWHDSAWVRCRNFKIYRKTDALTLARGAG